MGLSEAYQRRRKRELEQMGAMMLTATGNSKEKRLDRVIKVPPSRLHGGRRRGSLPKWWGEGAG